MLGSGEGGLVRPLVPSLCLQAQGHVHGGRVRGWHGEGLQLQAQQGHAFRRRGARKVRGDRVLRCEFY